MGLAFYKQESRRPGGPSLEPDRLDICVGARSPTASTKFRAWNLETMGSTKIKLSNWQAHAPSLTSRIPKNRVQGPECRLESIPGNCSFTISKLTDPRLRHELQKPFKLRKYGSVRLAGDLNLISLGRAGTSKNAVKNTRMGASVFQKQKKTQNNEWNVGDIRRGFYLPDWIRNLNFDLGREQHMGSFPIVTQAPFSEFYDILPLWNSLLSMAITLSSMEHSRVLQNVFKRTISLSAEAKSESEKKPWIACLDQAYKSRRTPRQYTACSLKVLRATARGLNTTKRCSRRNWS
ncbi:uncharacterized protein BDR25DRAFT_354627 [Lindgomyces ingoldianus]|uniref:Uncharacterized protein n=1 Tax=Lindgomyces ingoldianus TaxID=673940 RepID=A0ACB6QYN2_9PLEO|nr:uncharacterized protein BDR25DRAFT_354627 [Lindgomyces ingoldianus]KAF2471387.1 hypothetical protein BDR25DRAFT_354627 [Lindgomyces ingoldianus]